MNMKKPANTATGERRESQRRRTLDRRADEARRQLWRLRLLPILVTILGGALVSWGAYVTHLSYSINANYEKVFLHYISEQKDKESAAGRRLDVLNHEFNAKLESLRTDVYNSMAEMRSTLRNIYNLLAYRSAPPPMGPEDDNEKR